MDLARPVSTLGLTVLLAFSMGNCGCTSLYQRIDPRLAIVAQRGVDRPFHPSAGRGGQRFEDDEEPERRSVIVAELLAIFPGLFVHGLGHYYAGDYETARRLRRVGEWGYLFTALGGGIGVGAYFLDQSQDNFFPTSMYITAGTVGAIGLGFFLFAWIGDIYDTPRAVRTGGEPWSFFDDEEHIFDD
jgi:hypothetical protein